MVSVHYGVHSSTQKCRRTETSIIPSTSMSVFSCTYFGKSKKLYCFDFWNSVQQSPCEADASVFVLMSTSECKIRSNRK